MDELHVTVQRASSWKSGEGQFVDFDGCDFFCWHSMKLKMAPGQKYTIRIIRETLGSSNATHKIVEAVPFGETQERVSDTLPRQKSALPEMARATNAKVAGGVEALPAETSRTDVDACLLAQANAIKELRKALGMAQARIEELDTKVSQVEALARAGGNV